MAGSVLDSSIYGDRNGGRRIDAVSGVFDIPQPGPADQERVKRYREYWRVYKGFHWNYERGQGGNPDAEPFVTMNYGRRIVDAHVNFLMKNGWEVTIPDDPETDADEGVDRSFIKHRLDKVWALNDKDLFSFEIAQVGGVTGDGFVRVYWDEEIAAPRAEVIPSQLCFPEYTGSGHRRRMARCTIYREEVQYERKLTLRGYRTSPVGSVVREVWTPEIREIWMDDERTFVGKNVFGEVPVAHFINYPVAGEPFGLSDLHVVADLQKLINETATDIKDVIEYYGSPVTVLTGARVQELERGAGKVWSLPKDAEAKNLELQGDLGASHKFLETVMDAVFNLSGTPKAVLGGDFKVTGTSGATLAMAFMPMLEIRNVKTRTYGDGLRKVNRLMLKAIELMDPVFLAKVVRIPIPERYMTDIAFNSPLPRDEANELQTAITRVKEGFSTTRRELLAMGHSEQEANEIMEEWRQEKTDNAQVEFNLGQFLPGGQEPSGNPNPQRPNTHVQGQAIADQAMADRGTLGG